MNDRELIAYCKIHCTTERALFHKRHVDRMLELAGYPEGFVRECPFEWVSLTESMEELCALAEARLKEEVQDTPVTVSKTIWGVTQY